ncbi:sarcosine oxidase [Arthrobacter alpinus]|uniref:Sarcosine oxidase n=1 Tax=Arthrobacter alpinus TaxID=656366 RepID=A0A1H5IKW5_9MICC|nr:FAD-dependent oxidoreductase [Arthrobacter alpinus]SEE40852.1 sarcosine oxidase [Arthrobacter alpinus]
MVTNVDVVVIGGGAMGSAAALSVARRGKSVVLLERFAAGHSMGASHGATRNFNIAYQRPEYLRLVSEARALWDDLALETGVQLLDLVGLVNHGHLDVLKAIHHSHQGFGIKSSFMGPQEAMDRWQGMRFRSDVLFVPESGRVRAADALMALRQAAESKGAQFLYETPVRDLAVLGDDLVSVSTDSTEYRATRVIVTAGAWTRKLLQGIVELPRLVVTQEQPAHFQPVGSTFDWPSFNHNPDPGAGDDDYWYSPTYGMLTPGEGIKIGWHGVGPVVDPDERSFTADVAQMEALRRYVSDWFPGLDADSFEPISCTYTSTDTGNFILDKFGPIVLGAGFSGHGFKFTPAIGRILADLADGIESPEIFRAPGSR